ncbi:MAG: DNA methyltransferase [Acidobacteriaceae bacterium]
MKGEQLHLTLGTGKSHEFAIRGELHLGPNPKFGSLCDLNRPPKLVDAPFERAITAGKNSYVYDAHTYHTKVPPQGISSLIEHYTRPNDVVLDPFCGSGMTGVAATSLGRRALLSDLSPAAVFISYNLNTPIDQDIYLDAIRAILNDCQVVEENLYSTHCRTCNKVVPMLYMVWSFGLLCNGCGKEFVLWNVARSERPNLRESKILAEFDCPHCGEHIKKRGLERTKRYPVSVGYRCCQSGLKESTAPPDEFDLRLIDELDKPSPAEHWYPTDQFPDGVNTRQPIAAGITSVDKAYTPRALRAMSLLWGLASAWPEEKIRQKLLFTVTSLYQRVTVFSEFRFWGGSGNTANYNVPAIMNEQNVFTTFERKAKTISWYFREAATKPRQIEVSTQSATCLSQLHDKSVDYVFTDPPFGANINYSEMNFLWESWLRIKTDNRQEAIVNKVQGKSYDDYQALLIGAFLEIRRVLKDESWLTVVFHNSSEEAWSAIQTSLYGAGFRIVGTQTFDKQHGTFKMFVSGNAVGYDLVLHCRKAEYGIDHSVSLDSREDAYKFLERTMQGNEETFRIKYLHVTREDEFDYRRLYANWLRDALPRTQVSLSFENFKKIVDERTTKHLLTRIA